MTPDQNITMLMWLAASIGFIHTLAGPDHYLPFIVMSRARNWSTSKTLIITALSGVGHVGSSVVLGLVGVFFGVAIAKIVPIEGVRGDIAAYMFIAFGIVYFIWGLRRAILNRPHTHSHPHFDGSTHDHEHTHNGAHAHVHQAEKKANITPWILFTIFVLGPCEPLIPILMYPAATKSYSGLILVTVVFAAVTIGTMLLSVAVGRLGINLIPLKKVERYTHALAGATIALCGALIVLGL